MGLSNGLCNAPTDSIPFLFIAFAASFISFIQSFFSTLIPSPPATSPTSSLDGLPLLAEFLKSNKFLCYDSTSFRCNDDCVVCLCEMEDGEKVRRLRCSHVFHSECLDGWFFQMKLSCPLCRSPLVV